MASYKLLYWPGIPGRGEYIRLAFEAAQVAYEDVKDIPTLRSVSEDVPAFAVPALECTSASGKTFKTSQTGAILNFLAPRLGLAGSAKDADEETKEFDRTKVNAITLTILDLSNEVHDSHHPIAVAKYYEEQKEEAKARSEDLRASRIPKFFAYFLRLLSKSGSGWLYGSQLTTADLVAFQVIDGLDFAFPRYMESLRASGKYDAVFELHKKVAALPGIAAYLKSPRRQPYSNGIYRHYPELDGEAQASS